MGAATTTPTAEGAGETPGATTDESQWRNRISAVRQARERAQLMAEALQNRVDGLWAEFTSRDDPAQRTVIGESRQAALEELENTSAEIEDLTQQIADIREEARRAKRAARLVEVVPLHHERRRRSAWTVETGFTLVELMMVAAIGTILLAITSISIGHVLESTRGDAALAGVLSQLRQARELAINR